MLSEFGPLLSSLWELRSPSVMSRSLSLLSAITSSFDIEKCRNQAKVVAVRGARQQSLSS